MNTQTIAQQLQHIYDPQLAEQYTWWLLEKLTNKTKTDLIAQKEIELSDAQNAQLQIWIDQIINQHKPIAYILGDVPFGDLMIKVEPPVLIPRPETEEWILNLAKHIKQSGAQKLRILDMCTGSGCIALLLAHELPDATIYAIDIADEAIALAQKNKQLLNIENIKIIQSDLFAQLPNSVHFDLIVCNPPYITDAEFAQLDPSVRDWEDKRALHADDNGTAIIKQIISQAPNFLRQNDQLKQHGIAQLMIEIGWQQAQEVEKLMHKSEYNAISTLLDGAQKDRIVAGRLDKVALAKNRK